MVLSAINPVSTALQLGSHRENDQFIVTAPANKTTACDSPICTGSAPGICSVPWPKPEGTRHAACRVAEGTEIRNSTTRATTSWSDSGTLGPTVIKPGARGLLFVISGEWARAAMPTTAAAQDAISPQAAATLRVV